MTWIGLAFIALGMFFVALGQFTTSVVVRTPIRVQPAPAPTCSPDAIPLPPAVADEARPHLRAPQA